MTSRLLLRLFLMWVGLDVMCLLIGAWQGWLFDIGIRGLIIDFLLGVLVLGQYLREHDRL